MNTLEYSTLPLGPLYDPKSKIRKYHVDEDYRNITLNALKNKNLYVDESYLPHLAKDIEWRRPKEICRNPRFIHGKPSKFDALVGDAENSWLVIAMEALTFNPLIFQFVVPTDQGFDRNYIGAFHFRFWQLGSWFDVVVDDRLPVFKISKELSYVHSKSGDVFWAALLEKAYCKMNNVRKLEDPATFVRGGPSAFQDLTGGIVESIDPKNPPPGRPLQWFIQEMFRNGSFGGCSILGDQRPINETGLKAKHSYLVSGGYYFEDKNSPNYGLSLIRIMNPWGEVEWTGEFGDEDENNWKNIDFVTRTKMEVKVEDDGEFWMKESDFVKFFAFLHVCHLGPGQYHWCHTRNRVTNWKTKTFRGEWIKRVSAGGPSEDQRYINPQYKIFISGLISGNLDTQIVNNSVIELTHKPLFDHIFPLTNPMYKGAGFFLYSLADVTDYKTRLDANFFKTNSPLNKVDFERAHRTEGRGYVDSFDLRPGWYCIVPCASHENVETSFVLRVFTESNVDKWEYDTFISKSSPAEVKSNEAVKYKELKHIFDEAAQHEEVDWIGLKDIFKRHSNALARDLSIQPSEGLGNEHIEFSKDECRSLIAMLDHDNTGKLNYNEFCSLWKKLLFWIKTYDSFRESEGYMKVSKLRDALSSIGFNLNKQVINKLIHFYANDEGKLFLTDFILCAIILETFFSRYMNSKTQERKGLSFTLEEWVRNILAI